MYRQSAKQVFSENVNYVAAHSGANFRSIIKSMKGGGALSVDYSYFHRVRNHQANLTMDKAEAILAVIKSTPELDWVEMWMLFIPNFFRESMKIQSGTEKLHHSSAMDFMNEVLDGVSALDLIHFSDTQRKQISKYSDYLLKSKYSKPKVGQ